MQAVAPGRLRRKLHRAGADVWRLGGPIQQLEPECWRRLPDTVRGMQRLCGHIELRENCQPAAHLSAVEDNLGRVAIVVMVPPQLLPGFKQPAAMYHPCQAIALFHFGLGYSALLSYSILYSFTLKFEIFFRRPPNCSFVVLLMKKLGTTFTATRT